MIEPEQLTQLTIIEPKDLASSTPIVVVHSLLDRSCITDMSDPSSRAYRARLTAFLKQHPGSVYLLEEEVEESGERVRHLSSMRAELGKELKDPRYFEAPQDAYYLLKNRGAFFSSLKRQKSRDIAVAGGNLHFYGHSPLELSDCCLGTVVEDLIDHNYNVLALRGLYYGGGSEQTELLRREKAWEAGKNQFLMELGIIPIPKMEE